MQTSLVSRSLCRWLGTAAVVLAPVGASLPAASITSLAGVPGPDLSHFAVNGTTADLSVIVGDGFLGSDGPMPYRWTPAGGPQSLGSLSATGTWGSAMAVSADGRVVVGWSWFQGNRTAFRWTEELGMVNIGFGIQGAFEYRATAVSADGTVIAGAFERNGAVEGFRWTAATGLRALTDDSVMGDILEVFGISADGSVIIGRRWRGGYQDLVRWTEAAGLEVVSDGGPYGSLLIQSMTPDASVVVGARDLLGALEAFRWTAAGGLQVIVPSPGPGESSFASAVSADGRTVIGWRSGAQGVRGFLWTEAGGLQEIAAPPGIDFYPLRLSASGNLLLASAGPAGALHDPWLWDAAHGPRSLEDELAKHFGLELGGRSLGFTRRLADDEIRILGGGTTAAGDPDLWIARLDGCRDTQEVPAIAGVTPGPLDPTTVHVLDGSGSRSEPGGNEPVAAYRWEVASGPAELIGTTDGPTVEVRATEVGKAVVRLTVDDGACANPASAEVPLHFCDLQTALNGLFVGLCDIPATETPRLSADGGVLVSRRFDPERLGDEAIRWTQTGSAEGLGDLEGGNFASSATGISRDGSVIVGVSHSGSSSSEIFRWTSAGGMVDLYGSVDFAPEGASVAVSADGSLLAWSAGGLPWYWTEETGIRQYASLGAAPGLNVKGLSDDGSILIGQGDTRAYHLAQAGDLQAIGDLPGEGVLTLAHDISADGEVVVGRAEGALGPEAIRWTPERGSAGLGDLPGGERFSEALAVSADGSVIVGTSAASDGDAAFIWDAERGLRRLQSVLESELGIDLSRWRLLAATDIAADGLTIAGHGIDPAGEPQVWLVRLDLCGDAPEIARIGDAPAAPVSTGVPVILDGSASSSAPGEGEAIVSYRWEIAAGAAAIDGPADEARVAIRGQSPGAVRVRLSVDDAGCGGRPAAAEVEIVFRAPSAGNWLLGDANGDARLDLSDAVFTLSHLFLGGAAPACVESTDTNQDGRRDLSDAVYTLGFLFSGGPPPAAPYPDCGAFEGCGDVCP